MQRRDYAGAGDLRDMQALVQRLWSPQSRWHVGDLAWGRHAIPGADETFRTSIWRDGTEVVAWGWAELPGHLDFVVDPAHADTAADVLTWFDGVTGPDTPKTSTVLETEAHLIETLKATGYVAQDDGPYFTNHLMTLDDLPEVSLPDGFVVRHIGLDQAERRAAVHRDGWSDFGSRVSTESYRRVMATWPYRLELDWVVEAADGTWVASALGWLDEVNQVGLLEPVGCAPAYRRRGLARAANVAALHALREAGATTAVVGPRGDAAYPAPARLYRGIGFQPGPRTVTYHRSA